MTTTQPRQDWGWYPRRYAILAGVPFPVVPPPGLASYGTLIVLNAGTQDLKVYTDDVNHYVVIAAGWERPINIPKRVVVRPSLDDFIAFYLLSAADATVVIIWA